MDARFNCNIAVCLGYACYDCNDKLSSMMKLYLFQCHDIASAESVTFVHPYIEVMFTSHSVHSSWSIATPKKRSVSLCPMQPRMISRRSNHSMAWSQARPTVWTAGWTHEDRTTRWLGVRIDKRCRRLLRQLALQVCCRMFVGWLCCVYAACTSENKRWRKYDVRIRRSCTGVLTSSSTLTIINWSITPIASK